MLRKASTLLPYAVVIAVTVALFRWPAPDGREEFADREAAPQSVPVRTTIVVRDDMTDMFEAVGTAEAWAEVVVSPQLDGMLTGVEVETGTPVGAGQLLARIDDRLLETDLEAAQAELAHAVEQLARVEELAERRLADQNRLQDAMIQERLAEVRVRRLETMLSLTALTSPIDGVVVSEQPYAGETVEQGVPLFSIADISRLRVRSPVPEAVARKLRVGSAATVRIDALGGREMQAAVWRIHPVSDPVSHQVVVELDAGDAFPALQPGNLVTVVFASDNRSGVLTLDRSAVPDVIESAEVELFRVSGGRAERRRVNIGLVLEDRVEVLDGLEEGDAVVTGAVSLADGDPVQVPGPPVSQPEGR